MNCSGEQPESLAVRSCKQEETIPEAFESLTMVQHSNTVQILVVVTACILLTLAAPPNSNDEKNNEGKVGMRYFPGGGYPGLYPGLYPGGYQGGFPGGFPGQHPGIYPGPFGLGYPPVGYPSIGYPLRGYAVGPIMFYSNKDGNSPAGSNTAPGGRQ